MMCCRYSVLCESQGCKQGRHLLFRKHTITGYVVPGCTHGTPTTSGFWPVIDMHRPRFQWAHLPTKIIHLDDDDDDDDDDDEDEDEDEDEDDDDG